MVNHENLVGTTYLALLSLTALGVVVVYISVNVDGAKDESVSDGGCTCARWRMLTCAVVIDSLWDLEEL